MSDTIFPISISGPITVSYNPTTGELAVEWIDNHPARENGLHLMALFDPLATQGLLSSIRELETMPGVLDAAPNSKNFVQ